jgi:uncharacterized protein YodC (DUF2158 family)
MIWLAWLRCYLHREAGWQDRPSQVSSNALSKAIDEPFQGIPDRLCELALELWTAEQIGNKSGTPAMTIRGLAAETHRRAGMPTVDVLRAWFHNIESHT